MHILTLPNVEPSGLLYFIFIVLHTYLCIHTILHKKKFRENNIIIVLFFSGKVHHVQLRFQICEPKWIIQAQIS